MDQIKFLDKFITIYGIKGISDHKTEISQSNVDDEDKLFASINGDMTKIKKLFKTSKLNLSRKKYKVDSVSLAFSILRNLLKQANIPFDTIHKKTGNFVRLIRPNNLLVDYIKNPNNIMYQYSGAKRIGRYIMKDYMKKMIIDDMIYENDSYEFSANKSIMQLDINVYNEQLHQVSCYVTTHLKVNTGKCVCKLIDDGILIEIEIPHISDLICDFEVTIADNSCIRPIKIEKSEIVVGNLILNDMNKITIKEPIPLICHTKHRAKIVLHIKKTPENILILTNDDYEIFIKTKCIYLQSRDRDELAQFSEIKYHNMIMTYGYDNKCKIKSADNKYSNQQENITTIIYNNKIVLPHNCNIIKNIQVGIFNLKSNKLEKNSLCNLSLTIDNYEVMNSRYNEESKSMIDIAIDPIPVHDLCCSDITLNFNTFTNLNKDCVIIMSYDTENKVTEKDKKNKKDEHKKIKFMNGFIRHGMFGIEKEYQDDNKTI